MLSYYGEKMSDRFPFPIPTGWFCVAWSHDLEVGQVLPLKYFGTDLVLFRTEDGVAHLLDAFCPHLGAHLGHGGVVDGDGIVCPFHAWKFDGAGTCTRIPYAKNTPKQAKLKPWSLVEKNNMILAWHSASEAPPQWVVPDVDECNDDAWSEFTYREWTVGSCNQETGENAVDSAHFCYLHGTQEVPPTKSKIINKHLMHTQSQTLMTTKMGSVEGNIDVQMFGFGFTLTRFTGLVETLLVSSNTPIDEENCHLRFSFTVKKFGGREITGGIGKAFVKEIARQLEQDIPVWENKIYLPRPVICDGDGPIGLYRNWAKGLYE